jgi:hypothetical protein
VARHEVIGDPDLRDDSRSVSSLAQHRGSERITDRVTFIDRGRIVDSSNRKTSSIAGGGSRQLPPGGSLPTANIIARVTDGQFVTLTTNQYWRACER